MGPISPPRHFPVAIKIAGGLDPERTIFIDGGVPRHTKWFDISFQSGPSLKEEDDIAFRLLLSFFDSNTVYTINSSIKGQWDDTQARRYEMKVKGLSDDNNLDEYKRLEDPTSSRNLIELLRCTLAEKVISENILHTAGKNSQVQQISSQNLLPTLSPKSIRITDSDEGKGLTNKKNNESTKSIKSTRFLNSTNHKEKNKPSPSRSREHSAIDEFISIYVQTDIKHNESDYMNADRELVRFSNKLAELEAKRLNLDTRTSKATLDEDKYSFEELNEIDLRRGEPFSMALECLENGYLAFLNGDLFCVYPHHFDVHKVQYMVFNGQVDLETVEVGGGKGPDRTLVVDLYDEVAWSKRVVVLTDENFAELVLASDDMWMVDAYTAWCPACEKLKPAWEAAAIALHGKIKIGASDCDRNEQLTEDLKVQYYPMIFCFPRGKKTINSYKVYDGNIDHLIPWAMQELVGVGSLSPIDSKEGQKLVIRTLRKKKKSIMARRGYMAGGYGYIFKKGGESTNQYETSSTKLIYISRVTQTKKHIEEDLEEKEDKSCVCAVM